MCATRWSILLLGLASACTTDPPVTQIFGVEWEETPTRRQDGVSIETSYRIEPAEIVINRSCGNSRAELRAPIYHIYHYIVLDDVMGTTSAEGRSCRSAFQTGDSVGFSLDDDGQDMHGRFESGEDFTMTPTTQVSGIFGGREFMEPMDAGGVDVIEHFFTPQYLRSKRKCSNGITSTLVVPIFIEHRFVVQETVRAGTADCEIELFEGNYQYYPEVAGELLLERWGGSRIDLRRAD